MLQQLLSVLSVAAIALAAYGLGRPILRGLGMGRLDRLSHAVWCIVVGLIAAGTVLAGLGLVGGLYAPLICVVSLSVCFGAIGQLVHGFGRRRQWRSTEPAPPDLGGQVDPAPWAPPPRWMHRSILALAALACAGSLLAALAPPTAGDALCYHLELPKNFLAAHAIQFLPDDVNCTYPLLVEMWYLWGLALDSPVTAGLIHWGLGVLLALATVVLATPIVGRPWAWIAGALVVLVPGVNNQMTVPLNDVALALMTTLALSAWWRAVADGGSRRWFLLAGLAGGGALGTKYLAFVFAAAVAVHAASLYWRDRRQRTTLLHGVAIVAVVSVSLAGPWYVRAAWHRGNPVYPFLSRQGDCPDFRAAKTGLSPSPVPSKLPLGRSIAGLAAAPWQLTMHPERFGGRGHQLGVVFLAAAAGVFVVRRLRGLGMLMTVVGAYATAWFVLRQNVRFLLPVVPLLAVAVTWVWIEMRRFPKLPRQVVAGAFAVTLAAYAAVGLLRAEGRLRVALGLESREQFLLRHEPTWQAADVSNRLVGRDAHLLSQDHRAFYFDCKVTRENLYRARTGYNRRIVDPTDFSRQLRTQGFTHLLLAENLSEHGIQYDPTLSRLADAQWAAGDDASLLSVNEYRFTDADGAQRRYRLVLLR